MGHSVGQLPHTLVAPEEVRAGGEVSRGGPLSHVVLQGFLELWPQDHQGPGRVEVDVISVVHPILVTLQVGKATVLTPQGTEKMVTQGRLEENT